MIRAVGFDLDNTLFDHTSAAATAIQRFVLAQGWSYTGETELMKEWKRLEDHYFSEYVAGNLALSEFRPIRMREFLISTDVDPSAYDLDELFNQYLFQYALSWVSYSDVRPALEDLKSTGLRMAVLTNGRQDQQEAKLEAMGLADMFDAVLAIGSVDAIKPDPRAFAHLCRELNCEPAEVLFVGDDVEIDVRASIDAGLQGVWLNREKLPTPKGITLQIQTLSALKDLL